MAGCGNSVFGAHALVDFHHADGAFYLECACADMESGCAQLFDDLFCDLARFASRCVGEQNNEFVSAYPAYVLRVGQSRFDALAYLLKHFVACRVAEHAVYALEMIKVQTGQSAQIGSAKLRARVGQYVKISV